MSITNTPSITSAQATHVPRDVDPRWERPTLNAEQLDDLARDLDQIRADVRADMGEKDARYIKRVVRVQRALEVVGRCLVHFGFTPFTLVPGVLALGLSKILDNMAIGHNVMHGQFDWMNDPTLSSRTFDWDNTCDRESWQRTHNHEHHYFTNVLGKDRDFGYALFRLSDDVKWRPPHRIQLLELGILSAGFQWFVALHEMEVEKFATGEVTLESKRAYIRDTRAKILRVAFKEYFFFPALAGPFFLKVLLCNLVANLIRNLWASSVIFLGHFPHQAQTFTEADTAHESRGQWYLRQMLGSANIEGGPVMHVLTGQLSCQIEHHLFPDLPANRYEEMAPKVRAVCEKYGIAYNTGPFLRQYGSFLRRLMKYSARPSDERRVDPRYRKLQEATGASGV